MLAALLCNLPIPGSRRWFIIGEQRHYLTRQEFADLIAERQDEPEIRIETVNGVKTVPKRLIQVIKRRIEKRATTKPVEDEDDDLILLLAYA